MPVCAAPSLHIEPAAAVPAAVAPTTFKWTPLGVIVPSAGQVMVWLPVVVGSAKTCGATMKVEPPTGPPTVWTMTATDFSATVPSAAVARSLTVHNPAVGKA